MHANLPGTPTEYRDVVGRPRGDVPANPEAIVQARRMLTDSLPKIVMNDADAAEGGCGVVGLACEIPVAGRHLFNSLEQMRNRGNGKGGGVAMVGLDVNATDINVFQTFRFSCNLGWFGRVFGGVFWFIRFWHRRNEWISFWS